MGYWLVENWAIKGIETPVVLTWSGLCFKPYAEKWIRTPESISQTYNLKTWKWRSSNENKPLQQIHYTSQWRHTTGLINSASQSNQLGDTCKNVLQLYKYTINICTRHPSEWRENCLVNSLMLSEFLSTTRKCEPVSQKYKLLSTSTSLCSEYILLQDIKYCCWRRKNIGDWSLHAWFILVKL